MLGKRTAGHEADKLLIEQVNECYPAPPPHWGKKGRGVAKHRRTGGRRTHAATMSLQQSRSEHLLHPFHACACRRERDACARSANCNAALLHYGGEQAQVGKIKMHGASPRRVTIL